MRIAKNKIKLISADNFRTYFFALFDRMSNVGAGVPDSPLGATTLLIHHHNNRTAMLYFLSIDTQTTSLLRNGTSRTPSPTNGKNTLFICRGENCCSTKLTTIYRSPVGLRCPFELSAVRPNKTPSAKITLIPYPPQQKKHSTEPSPLLRFFY